MHATIYRNEYAAQWLAAALNAQSEDGWSYEVRRVPGGYVVAVFDETGAEMGDL